MINIKAESIKNTENHYKMLKSLIKKIRLNKYVPNN